MRKVIIFFLATIFASSLYSLHITLPQAQYSLALELYSKGRYRDAIKEFKNLIEEHPQESGYVGNSYYWLGLSYLSLKEYKSAENNFKKVINHFYKSKYYIDSFYQLGRSYYIWGKFKSAINVFTKVYKRYPQSRYADNSLLWRGVAYYKLGNNKRALQDFYRILKEYPKSNKADAARYMIVYIKGGRTVVVKEKAEIDTSKLESWEELLKTKEQALAEKETELKTKESVLTEKENLINQAQEKLKKE